MDFYELYATDATAEEKGRAFSEEFGGDVTFVLARAGNRTYTRMIQAQFEAHRHILELKDTPEQEEAANELSFKLIGQVMASSIVLGWSGNVKYKGQDLPYSYNNAVLLLSHKDFRAKILGLADNFRNYLVSAMEKDAKNSAPTSDGSSPGEPVSLA